MKLILTRHGETIENKENILQGHLPGTLSKKGLKQAKKLALRLKDKKIDCIYSSDLKRAADTAREIAKFHNMAPLRFVKSLREVDLGKFAGKKGVIIDWLNRPKEIESKASMQARVKKIFDRAYEKYPNGTVLFVGHAGINKALLRVIFNKPPSYKEITSQPNAAVSVFEIKEDKNHKVNLLNCTNHLD